MSKLISQALDSWLFFGGEMPNLAEGVSEVPLPEYQPLFLCKWCTNKRYKDGICQIHYMAAHHKNITVHELKSKAIAPKVNSGKN